MAKLDSDDPLALLQHWYLSRCDGEWEHQRGITIESLDNPGDDVATLDSDDPLALLQPWYLSCCDSEREHQRGIRAFPVVAGE
ncbi:MAG: hypothetical protein E6J45_14585 [Chloroflexi bacterium]|nr:MAG: hypothetical protein E6J45_14585 [Chloroflexota bacterium]